MNQKSSQPAVVCKGIHKFYGEGETRVEALRGIDLTINKGELRMLMGPSGSGKTTLISIIVGILTQTSGECLVNNVDLNHLPDQQKTRYRGSHFGFVFQAFNLIPSLTIEENISIPLLINGVPFDEAVHRSREVLKELNIGEKYKSYPRDLSGGQQQRVAIARAIVHNPELIVCDEPTSFLDHENGTRIMEILKEMVTQKGLTLIVVTHDPRIVQFADKVNHLEDGVIKD